MQPKGSTQRLKRRSGALHNLRISTRFRMFWQRRPVHGTIPTAIGRRLLPRP